MKNNIGYVDYTDNSKIVNEELEILKTLPPGIYEYSNLGLLIKEMEKKDFNIDNDTLERLEGFIVISHYDIKSKYEVIITNNDTLKDNIYHAYYNENTDKFVLITSVTGGGQGLITSIDVLDNLNKDTDPYYDDLTPHNILTNSFVNYTFLPYYLNYGECDEQDLFKNIPQDEQVNDTLASVRFHGPIMEGLSDLYTAFFGTLMFDPDKLV